MIVTIILIFLNFAVCMGNLIIYRYCGRKKMSLIAAVISLFAANGLTLILIFDKMF